MSYKFNYKDLQIIKHALQHYVRRENAIENDIETEFRLLTKITNEVDELKEKYGID